MEALELFKQANILPGAAGLREFSKMQGVLTDYQIIVINYIRKTKTTEIILNCFSCLGFF